MNSVVLSDTRPIFSKRLTFPLKSVREKNNSSIVKSPGNIKRRYQKDMPYEILLIGKEVIIVDNLWKTICFELGKGK